MGHEVIISSYWGLSGSPTVWDGITVLPGFGGSYCSASLAEHAKHVLPDLVITLGDVWVLDPNLLRDLPVVHWLPADTRPMSYVDKVEVISAGNRVMAMSRFGYQRFIDTGFTDALYCPHAIDTEVFRPPDDRKELREAFGFPGDLFVVGVNAANNDAIRKAAPEMMLAFARFLADHPDSVLALHASIHQEGGQDLEFLGEHLGITDRMLVVDQYRYQCGLITPEDMASWTQAVDVLLAATYAEGFGLPVLEAQACGTPVITTDASAMTELNPHGFLVQGEPFWNGVHRGWWTRPSIPGIVKSLEWAYENRDCVSREQLREFALAYDINKVAEEYMRPAVEDMYAGYTAGKPGNPEEGETQVGAGGEERSGSGSELHRVAGEGADPAGNHSPSWCL